jgi:hypothetical protein
MVMVSGGVCVLTDMLRTCGHFYSIRIVEGLGKCCGLVNIAGFCEYHSFGMYPSLTTPDGFRTYVFSTQESNDELIGK